MNNDSNNLFMAAKLRKVENKTKEIHFFFLPRRRKFALIERKVTKNFSIAAYLL